MNRFDILFQLYLSNKATDAELDELLRLAPDKVNEAEILRIFNETLDQYQGEEGVRAEKRLEILNRVRAAGNATRPPVHRDTSRRLMWMVAASLTIIIAAGIFVYPEYSKKQDVTIPADKTVTLHGKDYVRLPDGSVVTLKEGSTLTYTKRYGKDTREVTLTGEAYFDVAHNPLTPFKVRTGKLVTTVLGTAFNIKVTVGDKVTVTVSRGEVAVSDERTSYGTLRPNEQIAVNTQSNEFVRSVVDAKIVTHWKNEFFILDKVTVAQAADMIGKRFNVNVNVTNKTLNDCVISAWFLNNENLDQIVSSISDLKGATYRIEDDKVTIEGGKGCGGGNS
jgi:transmembrane sensor